MWSDDDASPRTGRRSCRLFDRTIRLAGAVFLAILLSGFFVNCHVSSDIHMTFSNGVLTKAVTRMVDAVALRLERGA